MYLKETVDKLLKKQNRSLRWLASEMGKSFDGLKLSLVKGSIKYKDMAVLASKIQVHPGELFESDHSGYSVEEWRNVLEEGEIQYTSVKKELLACKELTETLRNQIKDKERIIELIHKSNEDWDSRGND